MVKTFNEFKVFFGNNGEVLEKKQTKRGTVRISEQTAAVNNYYSNSTMLRYELVDDDVKTPEREEMEARATGLGISFRSNIGDEKLLEKIKAEESK